MRSVVGLLLICLFSCSRAWLVHNNAAGRSSFRLSKTKLNAEPQSAVAQKAYIGIPRQLNDMRVGSTLLYEGGVIVEKISCNPPIFLLRNFLSTDECQEIMDSAIAIDLQPGRTVSGNSGDQVKRKNSVVGWMDNEKGIVSWNLAKRAHDILMPNQFFHSSRGVEPLQVVRYDDGGEYVLHQDSNNRLLTVLSYINGVGETWFPLADSERDVTTRWEALKYCQDLQPGEDGVLVSCEGRGTQVRMGDAVAFFNYFTDASPDWKAIHAGLPVTRTKWIANHFFHDVPFGFTPES